MRLRENLLLATMAFIAEPLRRRARVWMLCTQVEFNVREILQQADEEERHLVVRKLRKQNNRMSAQNTPRGQ